MKYNLLIWDFNGTLTDDVAIGIECINSVLDRRNMKKIDSVEQYREIFCFPIIDYYKRLGFDFEAEPYDKVANEWTREYHERETHLQATPYAAEILEKVKSLGMRQIILSSSEITRLKRQIGYLGIAEYFDTVLGLDNIYGGGKTEIARRWSKDKDFKAIFIGDTLHDYETAKAIGADCLLYSGGHEGRWKLESAGVPVIDNLLEIEKYIV